MATKTNSKPEFPTKELKAWLQGRKVWNHNEWIALLTDLRSKGYSILTDNPKGRDFIGKFLETNRSK